MLAATRVAWLVFVVVALSGGRDARAAAPPSPRPLAVLSIWTDDADDPADALTHALRARVRSAPSWSLVDTAQSFETLAIALRCPPKPDAACLQRIGDQLRADHYVWGTVAKRKPALVTAEVHLWSRGEPGADATATYSEALTDPNDPALRAIADRLFGKLTGTEAAVGTIVVRAGAAGGLVVIDGHTRETLRGGVARVVVDPGEHTVAVHIPGYHLPVQTASVAANETRDVDFELTAPEGATAPDEASSAPTEHYGRSHVRGILGYTAIGVGAALLVVSGIEAARWFGDKNASDTDRQNVPRTVTDVCADPVNASAADACEKSKSAKTVSTLGWVFAAAGAAAAGTGLWLVLTDSPPSSEGPRDLASVAGAARRARFGVELLPSFDVHTRSLDVRMTF